MWLTMFGYSDLIQKIAGFQRFQANTQVHQYQYHQIQRIPVSEIHDEAMYCRCQLFYRNRTE